MKKRNKIIISIISILLIIFIAISTFIAVFILSNKEYYKDEKNINIPIFVYHDVVKEKTAEDFMQTTDEIFKKQITGLLDLGYQFISYEDLVAYNNGEKKLKNKVVLLTFDDGLAENYTTLFPIIKELNVPITINLIDAKVGNNGYMNWDQIKEMYASGLVSFHTHGKFHLKASEVDTKTCVENVLSAHKNIEENLDKTILKVFTYPYGVYDEEKISTLEEEGFIQNLTDNKVNDSKTLDLSKLHREYPLNHSVFKILLKTFYRIIKY